MVSVTHKILLLDHTQRIIVSIKLMPIRLRYGIGEENNMTLE